MIQNPFYFLGRPRSFHVHLVVSTIHINTYTWKALGPPRLTLKLSFHRPIFLKLLPVFSYQESAKKQITGYPKNPTKISLHNDLKAKNPKQMSQKTMEVVKNLDIKRYMGRWYEIASFPSRFQPRNGVNTRATYTLNEDGTVHVLNETFTDGKRGFIEGTAYKADPQSDEAKLKVKFYVPPFLPIIPIVGDYWVLYLDDDYQYALIGQPSRNYLWVCLLSSRILFVAIEVLDSSNGFTLNLLRQNVGFFVLSFL